MVKDVTSLPVDTMDFRVFRAIMVEAPRIMELALGPLPETDAEVVGRTSDGEEDPRQRPIPTEASVTNSAE